MKNISLWNLNLPTNLWSNKHKDSILIVHSKIINGESYESYLKSYLIYKNETYYGFSNNFFLPRKSILLRVDLREDFNVILSEEYSSQFEILHPIDAIEFYTKDKIIFFN
jgi:hypothetical protein